MRLIDGSYTKRVMLVTIITNIIDGVLTSIWLLNDRIMNSGFFDGIEQLLGTDAEGISHVFIHYNKVFLSIIILDVYKRQAIVCTRERFHMKRQCR